MPQCKYQKFFLKQTHLFSSTVFIPSCLCWRPPAGSVSSCGLATETATRPLTAREEKLWCRRRRTGKTIPWVCGGPGRSALPPRRARAQRWWRPEAPSVHHFFQECFLWIKLVMGQSDCLCNLHLEVKIHFWIIFKRKNIPAEDLATTVLSFAGLKGYETHNTSGQYRTAFEGSALEDAIETLCQQCRVLKPRSFSFQTVLSLRWDVTWYFLVLLFN